MGFFVVDNFCVRQVVQSSISLKFLLKKSLFFFMVVLSSPGIFPHLQFFVLLRTAD